MILQPAAPGDLHAVAALMNLAYRGGGEAQGWTSEAGYIDGDRTSAALLGAELSAAPAARLLLYREGGELVASVWVEPLGAGTWYLGSLTVSPARQDRGLGRRLLAAAEHELRAQGACMVRMTVVEARHTLIAWYQRRGYRLTGETEPWPYGDERFGSPRRDDLRFVVLEKPLLPPT